MSGSEQQATVITDEQVRQLAAGVRGRLLRPGDDGFEAARRVWNGMIDRTPALILRCTGAADVQRGVEFARTHGLLLAVRGGGHGVAGNAVCDGGLVLDLSPMKGARVDLARQTIRAQAGSTWGDFDHETQAFGLATTGGLISTTGIAGLTLGGGIGWLMRQYGLTCDNLLSADVVTADGQFLTASPEENADLFWGLRGGGGNFGVVTSFEYRLHPVGMVLGGLLLHPASKAGELLRFFREYTAAAPDAVTSLVSMIVAPPAPFVPESLQGRPAVAVVLCCAGPREEAERIVRPLREFGPPAADLVQPLPYTALQSFLDPTAPPGLLNYWKSDYLRELSDAAIETMVAHAAQAPSPLFQVHLHHMHGAVSRVGANETAFSNRDAPYALNAVAMWTDPAETEQQIGWARAFSQAMRPHATGGVYVNFMGEEADERVRAAYGPAYERLAELKHRYDPANLFRLNHNIRPRG